MAVPSASLDHSAPFTRSAPPRASVLRRDRDPRIDRTESSSPNEQPANNLQHRAVSACRPACRNASHSAASPGITDARLDRIIDAWPTLPDPIRRAMLALVETPAKR
jgi:hypothetical protein